MQFSVESWSPEFGVGADENQLALSDVAVNATVECQLEQWAPIAVPPGTTPVQRMLFVDGVRRIEARVWITSDGITRVGLCATVAAGSVLCEPGLATVTDVVVERGLFARPAANTESIHVSPQVSYTFLPAEGDSPAELNSAMHAYMTAVESRIAANHDVQLVVFDGPLRGRTDPLAVGYVKTQHVQYLPEEVAPVLAKLGVGERTPLFQIGGVAASHYSWYLRLPGKVTQPLAGLVRCEIAGATSALAAAERANVITATLPKFASEAHKDPRAPQNLYPIAGLEQQLKHRMGDQDILVRMLRRAEHSAASAAT